MTFKTFASSIFFAATLSLVIRADDLSPMTGGISPDGKWAVVVGPAPKGTEHFGPGVPVAYLINNQTKRTIGPLEEVDLEKDESGRGGDAQAFWSKESRRLLTINDDPDGFMAEFDVVYKISRGRAYPQNVENVADGPLISKTVTMRSRESTSQDGSAIRNSRLN